MGVEAVPVADYVDLVSDPTLLARGHFVELLHDVLGPVMAERSGSRFSDDRGGYEGAAPSLGRDNLAVLGTLGLDAADLERLSHDGVVR